MSPRGIRERESEIARGRKKERGGGSVRERCNARKGLKERERRDIERMEERERNTRD